MTRAVRVRDVPADVHAELPRRAVTLEPTSNQGGFLALVEAFDDVPEFTAALDVAVASRHYQKSRPAPVLGT